MLKKIIIFSIICYVIFNLLGSNCIGEYETYKYSEEDLNPVESNIQFDGEQDLMLNDIHLENELKDSYEMIFAQKYEDFQLIPLGTKINKIVVDEGNVLVDFSREILNYGGNTWEDAMINQLLGVAFAFEQVNSVTFTIDNNTENFVEGSVIYRYTRINWNERNYLYNEGSTED